MQKIVQGDTTVISVTIDGHEYNENDIVRFALAPDMDSPAPLISKEMTYDLQTGTYTVELSAAETAQLTANERYFFDIGLQNSGGKYYRAVLCTEIWVAPGISEVSVS